MSRWVLSVERRIAAPADEIYAVVADPDRHRDFDGSDALRGVAEASSPARPLVVGDHFSMNMDLRGQYVMTSTVVEAEPGRRFAWQSRPHKSSARWRSAFGGRIWRYELEPDGGTTLVRESWDLTEEPLRVVVGLGRPVARDAMTASLERLARLVERS
ncbi:Uncharacterized conserved protein YndB, AHSA1/START domain [Lentzea fradiae]|uniref:Uncharacterized conserved protein YndB, AHSA1/START domain n=1 Tax=Lentzea fradiae TaxID=200378 RepID=A0A1G7K1W4_9PSEU|nr:SRPBCC family protein [Lentzea fradiae]SDF31243.1 Uncharacterized conserved protein YndB, AHSA1/START domain [Lentzea fradiae]